MAAIAPIFSILSSVMGGLGGGGGGGQSAAPAPAPPAPVAPQPTQEPEGVADQEVAKRRQLSRQQQRQQDNLLGLEDVSPTNLNKKTLLGE
jgi:hypothetical protein